ncbi:hypothetical protein K491DRAFT_722818 [Lophiostoma macrostomum CBS 122681]|uniref:Uncharacterized protein n=1 Tax=Lophiostoma macrostomum CBS 122681 TaxID=1314788 RepID=A0A6A6SMH3_9PLEO|nr:hypothetical protein K491DRAFT_722818 [Lophiostoma macrostomum CBS 122681]
MLQEIGTWKMPRVREGDTRSDWIECCEYLRALPNLHSLRMDLTIWYGWYDWEERHGPFEVDDDFIFGVLKPLKDIKVHFFEVELNITARPRDGEMDEVFCALGDVNFTWYKKMREVRYSVLRKIKGC